MPQFPHIPCSDVYSFIAEICSYVCTLATTPSQCFVSPLVATSGPQGGEVPSSVWGAMPIPRL